MNPGAQAAWQAGQQAAGPNTFFNRTELEKELAYNENELTILRNELQKLRADYGNLDETDRAMAANRIRRGDFGAAGTHLGNIEGRRRENEQRIQNLMNWSWQTKRDLEAKRLDRQKQTAKDKRTLRGEIEDVDLGLAGLENFNQKIVAVAKRNRLADEYKATYGESLPAAPNVFTKDEVDSFLINNTDKNGNFIAANGRSAEENKKMFQDLSQALNTSAGAQAAKSASDTDKEYKAKVEQERKNRNSAIDKVEKNIDWAALAEKGTYDTEVKIGKKTYPVKVTRSADGKMILKCGKVEREI